MKRTKIVATIGPASNSREIIKQMILAGMNVARLNFSHGSYEDHAKTVSLLRSVSEELDTQITLLQDLQGPKIRVGVLPEGRITLIEGEYITMVPQEDYQEQEGTVAIDYPYVAEEAVVGTQVLLDDGNLELKVTEIKGNKITCQVIQGGILKSRKGVNLPSLNLRLPSMTEKDIRDLEFGLAQGVDWISLSFVRRAEDVMVLRELLASHGAADTPVLAKIEKPQAIANLEAIVDQCDGIMVARGDLGVEISPEKVPLLQKQIIKLCNQKGIPVITATQMLESMISNSRPTRAEASDVANAILDGTDAVMLSGESAVGLFPVRSVQMLARIATSVEENIKFENYQPQQTDDETRALSEALNAIDKVLNLKCIVAHTSTGYTARLAGAERPKAPVIALTPNPKAYHSLNLAWGVIPVLIDENSTTFEEIIKNTEIYLREKKLVNTGDKVLIMAGIPTQTPKGTNFLKIHSISGAR